MTPGREEWTPPLGVQNPAYSLLQPFLEDRGAQNGAPGPSRECENGRSGLRYSVGVSGTFEPLRADEPIGVVALSSGVDATRLAEGLAELSGWGHRLILAPNLGAKTGYLAGSDEERLDGLSQVLDQGARIVVAARGGYGTTRLLPRLPWRRMASQGVVLVGFSDVVAVTNHLACAHGVPQIHGPMVAAGLAPRHNAERLRRVLGGSLVGEAVFCFDQRQVVRHGLAEGPAVGGNLSLLCALLGTPFEPRFDGAVVFLEEVGEPLYRLDRMLTQLASSGRLQHVKALIGGSLRSCSPITERTRTWRQLLVGVAPSGSPVVVGLPFGHGAANMAFPIGIRLGVDTRSGTVAWSD